MLTSAPVSSDRQDVDPGKRAQTDKDGAPVEFDGRSMEAPVTPERVRKMTEYRFAKLRRLLQGDANPYGSYAYEPDGTPQREVVGAAFVDLGYLEPLLRDAEDKRAFQAQLEQLRELNKFKPRRVLEPFKGVQSRPVEEAA